MIKKLLKKIYSPILVRIDKPEYLRQLERAYKAGYDYHQKMIKNDPELLSWITREHYFDDKYENKC